MSCSQVAQGLKIVGTIGSVGMSYPVGAKRSSQAGRLLATYFGNQRAAANSLETSRLWERLMLG
jgi:hypothetical protein